MEFNNNDVNNDAYYLKDIANEIKPTIESKNYENLHYLYPNGHRITHQMRWFKGSRDRGFKSDITA